MDKEDSKNNFGFSLVLKKKNPKPNAKTYEFETIDDIFQFITPKNFKKFFKEFKMGMELNMNLREALMDDSGKSPLKMERFKWTDD